MVGRRYPSGANSLQVTISIATALYSSGMDPWTKKPVEVAMPVKGHKLQRALMQFFKPENDFEVGEALIRAGRGDLIGGCEALIPPQPPKETVEARRRQAGGAERS